MTQFTSLRIGRPRSNCRRLGSWHLATTEASQAGGWSDPPSDFGRAQAEIIARRRWSVTGGARPPRKTVPRFTRGVQAWNTPPRRYVWGASQSSAGHPGFHAAPEATLVTGSTRTKYTRLASNHVRTAIYGFERLAAQNSNTSSPCTVLLGEEFGTDGEWVRHRFRPKRPRFATDSCHSFLQLRRTESDRHFLCYECIFPVRGRLLAQMRSADFALTRLHGSDQR